MNAFSHITYVLQFKSSSLVSLCLKKSPHSSQASAPVPWLNGRFMLGSHETPIDEATVFKSDWNCCESRVFNPFNLNVIQHSFNVLLRLCLDTTFQQDLVMRQFEQISSSVIVHSDEIGQCQMEKCEIQPPGKWSESNTSKLPPVSPRIVKNTAISFLQAAYFYGRRVKSNSATVQTQAIRACQVVWFHHKRCLRYTVQK